MRINPAKAFVVCAVTVGAIFLGALAFPYQDNENFDPWLRLTFQIGIGMPIIFCTFSKPKTRSLFILSALITLGCTLALGFGFSAIISASSQNILMPFEEDFLQILSIVWIIFLAKNFSRWIVGKLNNDKIRHQILWGRK